MKIVSPTKTYIDYFQGVGFAENGWNHFGVRVCEAYCLLVAKNELGLPKTSGREYPLPVQFEILPIHMRMIIDNHVLNYPASDLVDVMLGRKSFQQALESPSKHEPKRMTEIATGRHQNNSEHLLRRKSGA